MSTFFVDDAVIIDAWLVVLHRNKNQDERPLRILTGADLSVIHQLRREFAKLWAAEKQHQRYKTVRDEYLDQKATRNYWSPETRNLYASILATIGNWYRNGGRDRQARDELAQIRPGATLVLQFTDLPIQQQLQL